MAKKIKMGPNAPPLHKQLGVDPKKVSREQSILDMITMANQRGKTSAEFTRKQHKLILESLEEKGLIKLK